MTTLLNDTTLLDTTPAGVVVQPHYSLAFDAEKIIARGPADDFSDRIRAAEFSDLIDGRNFLCVPGLVNTHHHLYQSLTRCLPSVQNHRLFGWLTNLYDYWRGLDYHAVKRAAQVSIAELLRSGCTTTNDHFYIVPHNSDVRFEAVLEAADQLGIRLHLCRGGMTLGQSHGGLPPDDVCETDDHVLRDSQRLLDAYHDRADYALRRIDLAPCSPFNGSRELLRDTAALAREFGGVLLHTHLAETLDEQDYCLATYGVRPLDLLASVNFLGPDVYLAHCVHLNADELRTMARTGTGVAHCPTSNLRLGSGIAPLQAMRAAGVRVGLGVDGSSSNDGGNLLRETKLALLAARGLQALAENDAGTPSPHRAPMLTPHDALWIAIRGGANLLNRPVLGHLDVGAAADFALYRNDDIALAGAVAHDPVAALVLCDPPHADRVYVAGREVVRDGRLTTIDEARLAHEMNRLVADRFTRPTAPRPT